MGRYGTVITCTGDFEVLVTLGRIGCTVHMTLKDNWNSASYLYKKFIMLLSRIRGYHDITTPSPAANHSAHPAPAG